LKSAHASVPLSLRELAELALAPPHAPVDFSPLSERKALLFDARGNVGLSLSEREAVAKWLLHLSCPTIAVVDAGDDDVVVRAADVTLADDSEVAPLLAPIQHSPIAAAILVQLLRATEGLSIPSALTAESLAYSTLQSGPEFRSWLADNPHPADDGVADDGLPVLVVRTDDRLDIELNRASRRNAISVEVRDGLVEAFQLAAADNSIRAVRLSGRGRCFSVGGDLVEFGSAADPATAHVVRSLTLPARFLVECADRVEVHVQGACIGAGVELPAFARRVIAADDAFFQLPELRFGLIPGAGGCVSIPRRIGRQRAAWLALSGRRINAGKALEWGLVDEIVS
jgi:hypothetical protein